jgi:hypothetical protein
MDMIKSPYPEDSDPVLLRQLLLEMARTIRNHSNDRRLIAIVDSLFDTMAVVEIANALRAYNKSGEIYAEPTASQEGEPIERYWKLYDLVGAFIQQAEVSEYINEDEIPLIQNKAYVDLKFFYEFPGMTTQ